MNFKHAWENSWKSCSICKGIDMHAKFFNLFASKLMKLVNWAHKLHACKKSLFKIWNQGSKHDNSNMGDMNHVQNDEIKLN